jgi:hypothetical protein
MRDRAGRVALSLVAVLALVTVVAIAASGSTSHGTSDARRPSDSLFDAFFTLLILGAVAGGVLLVYGLSQRRAIAEEIASGRYKRTSVLGFLTFFVLVVGAFGIARRLNIIRHAPPVEQDQSAVDIIPGVRKPPDHKPTTFVYEPGISWLVVTMLIGLVIAAAVAYLVSRRRAAAVREPDLAKQLAVALGEAVDDLRSEADPRRAIIAAYARMERVLAASGAPKRTTETADEYLARVLLELAPESDAVVRLTDLFSQAKFSHHEIDMTMKEEAIDALEQIRDELRTATEAPVEQAIPAAIEAPS